MRQCHTVANAGAVEFFSFVQCAQERLPRLGLTRKLRNLIHQLSQHRVAVRALQIQIDDRGRKQST